MTQSKGDPILDAAAIAATDPTGVTREHLSDELDRLGWGMDLDVLIDAAGAYVRLGKDGRYRATGGARR